MSIRINNKIIAGNSNEAKSTSYRYVGEIFQSAIPIDDIKVACLDGHKIYSDEGYGSFIQHLISQSVLYPQLVCTEEVWQEKVTQYGSWGQFVINTQENSVRLPKIAGFVQGLNTLEDLTNLLEAGLPNITGKAGGQRNRLKTDGDSGCFTSDSSAGQNPATDSASNSNSNIVFDASLSNPIYGNSDTVQPQAIQYPYYIVLATGVVQEINVKKEVELNNPFFFGMYQYFETNPNNVSWLKSEGQWNNGSIYESFYEWLVNSYNDTESGVSVKLNSDTYTNFDYVLNQNDKTFRLPIEVKQKFYNDISGSIPVVGNGMTLGLTNGTNNAGLVTFGGNNLGHLGANINDYGRDAGVPKNSSTFLTGDTTLGVTSDPTKSGIEAQITQTEVEGLGLYFYVGETVQNANLVNVGRIEEKVASLLPDNSNLIAGYGLPDYSAQIILDSGAGEKTYVAPSKGWFGYNFIMESNNTGYVKVNDIQVISNRPAGANYYESVSGLIPIDLGDVVKYYTNVGGGGHRFFNFYPMKGAN